MTKPPSQPPSPPFPSPDTVDQIAAYCGFLGHQCIAQGTLLQVACAAQAIPGDPITHIFDNATGRLVDVDLRGSAEDLQQWISVHHPDAVPESAGTSADAPKRGRGRPKLGVVAKEITLLPRHWDWLAAQSGGASVTLRRLIDQARKDPRLRRKDAQNAVYRFATSMAGDQPGFEEAMRALFADDQGKFEDNIKAWPADVVRQTRLIAQGIWPG